MGKIKEMLGEAPPTLGAVARLGAMALFVTCPPPCKRRSRVLITALRLSDDTPFDEITSQRRLVCRDCDRRAGPAAISIDWDFTASKPQDGRWSLAAGADELRALAARMAQAAGRRIVVQAHSAETVAYVLRAYADIISRPGVDDVGPFSVDVWDGGGIIETLAKCSNLLVARAAYDQAVKERGRYEVTLRSGIRIVAAHRP